MRLLLASHALVWYVLGNNQLSETARAAIQNGSNEVLISPASYWEIAIKLSIGKWQLNEPFERFIDGCLNGYGFRILAIAPEHAARVITLPFPPNHKDPFDRLLVAQALVEDVALVSADQVLDVYGVRRVW